MNFLNLFPRYVLFCIVMTFASLTTANDDVDVEEYEMSAEEIEQYDADEDAFTYEDLDQGLEEDLDEDAE